jgi:hypothetical protein
MATLAELLRQGSDKLINLPSEAQRFITNPQAFTQLLTGKNPLPRETGFAAGATGLPADQISVLDPNQMEYMKGYEQGEPFGIAAMALPLVVPTAKALAPKAGQMAENYMVNQGFMPSIVPPNQAKMADALRQPPKNELGFYSPLDEAVMNLQNQKGTGQQYLAQLLKTQGVKQEEVATRGLDTFLNQNPKVTKTQIEDFLGQNPVKLRETVLGVPEKFDADRLKQLETEYAGLKQHAIDDPKFGELKYDEMIRLQNIRDNSTLDSLYARAEADERTAQRMQQLGLKEEADKYFKQAELLNTRAEKLDLEELGPVLPTKFGKSDFNIPNGENYREVLIQYPNEAKPAVFPKQAELDAVNEQLAQLKKAGNREQYGQLIGTRTALNNERTAFMKQAEYDAKNQPTFVNRNHFEQPNILAHMRVDDRVIDGKKTLFIQEIQSDWHQAGRKQGYATPETKRLTGTVEEQTSDYGFKPEYKVNWEDGTFSGGYGSREAAEAKAAEGKSNAKTGVPDAPFKNTEQWAGLAMKRAMQMAAEGGYDRVAFTTGKQQANRYDLSKQVDNLLYEKNPNGTYRLSAQVQGQGKMLGDAIPESNLADFVGKEVAEKIAKGAGNKTEVQGTYDPQTMTSSKKYMTELSGVDLQVGGEGMKGFYDKILPDFVNKYGKKQGLKVGKTDLPINSQDQIDIIKANAGRTYGVGSDAYNQALKNQYESVHYFDLTPEAKQSFLSKGQPMFAAAPLVAADEETRREMLEKLFNSQK